MVRLAGTRDMRASGSAPSARLLGAYRFDGDPHCLSAGCRAAHVQEPIFCRKHGADSRREQHRHAALLARVPLRDQPLSIHQDLRIQSPLDRALSRLRSGGHVPILGTDPRPEGVGSFETCQTAGSSILLYCDRIVAALGGRRLMKLPLSNAWLDLLTVIAVSIVALLVILGMK